MENIKIPAEVSAVPTISNMFAYIEKIPKTGSLVERVVAYNAKRYLLFNLILAKFPMGKDSKPEVKKFIGDYLGTVEASKQGLDLSQEQQITETYASQMFDRAMRGDSTKDHIFYAIDTIDITAFHGKGALSPENVAKKKALVDRLENWDRHRNEQQLLLQQQQQQLLQQQQMQQQQMQQQQQFQQQEALRREAEARRQAEMAHVTANSIHQQSQQFHQQQQPFYQQHQQQQQQHFHQPQPQFPPVAPNTQGIIDICESAVKSMNKNDIASAKNYIRDALSRL